MCKHYTILYLRDSSASMFRAIATQTGHRLLSLHKKMKIIAKKIVWIAIITMICMCVLNSLLAQCCFLGKLFNFNIFHLHGPFMRKNCLYFLLLKHAICWPAHII